MPLFNPFPGLRPFEADEDHLFFGRETEIDQLLRRLRSSRFVAVVGTSGSGKSSLVRSGLIPSLQSGFMAGAGSSWRIAVMRPGEDPIGHLAGALDSPGVLEATGELASTNRVLLEVTLRRSTLGLAEAVRQARLPKEDNVLVIVDQFEELFRFRQSQHAAHRDEAVAFVKLLLEATGQHGLPIYVVLTMRSDFIGDCMNFPGLPEAVNSGLYLVGRMSRDGLRAAITGPVAVAGGSIAPRLVTRVLNDLGDDHDQLPLVQHALMRTWDHWAARSSAGPIDLEDYDAIGTFRDSLSQHAEEAYAEATAEGLGDLTEQIFKALTDTFTDHRGVRRPTPVHQLAAIAEASEADVIRVVEIFRRPGRTFLMPPPAVPLDSRSVIDLSHESLMRCWRRLMEWAEQERAAAAFYVRLSQAARWFDQGTAGYWRNPELQLAQRWVVEAKPTPAWARRYDEAFDRAMAFLEASEREAARLAAEIERERRLKLRRTQAAAAVLATLLLAAIGAGMFAWRERQRAEQNLDLARQAVDESLAGLDRVPEMMSSDVPQVEELRRDLLSKAERFYQTFMEQEPRSEQARRDLARAHLTLGHINRMMERRDDATRHYREAIARFTALLDAAPGNAVDRQALGDAYNSAGENWRLQTGNAAEAQRAYDAALMHQQVLAKEFPATVPYQVDLARTLSNRGILRAGEPNGETAAEGDLRQAFALLDPHVSSSPRAAQEFGRVVNNLAAISSMRGASGESLAYFERAVAVYTGLVQQHPENRQYQIELAAMRNNLAMALADNGRDQEAAREIAQAITLLTNLARPAPSLAVERADAYNLRGVILQAQQPQEATRAYDEALSLFVEAATAPNIARFPLFHERFGDLLLNLATFTRATRSIGEPRRLLEQAIGQYLEVVTRILATKRREEITIALDTLTRVLPELPEHEQPRVSAMRAVLAAAAAR